MLNFKIVGQGFSPSDVEGYIQKLKNMYEARLAEQKTRISYLTNKLNKIHTSDNSELIGSLLSAIEKAKQLEDRSKNIYRLEAKKLNLIYLKMENLVQNGENHSDKELKTSLLKLIQNCKDSLKDTMDIQDEQTYKTQIGDPVKRLLVKMMDLNKLSPKYESNVDKASHSEEDIENNLTLKSSKARDTLHLGDSKFDLKEALNPKEDLGEIMKAFDFYTKMQKDS